ncbi:MAG: DUF1176 domain-containing protein [Devosiaceae bacterium]|nr:DUF1176 domain-containing protein [Devosiaceae bacterium]
MSKTNDFGVIMQKILIAISLVILSFSTAINASEIKQFKDWQVNCDKYDTCSASNFIISDKDIGPDYALSLSHNKYAEFWQLSLIAYAKQPDDNSKITLIIDGDEFSFSGTKEFAAYGKLNQYYFLGEKPQAFFNAMLPASKVNMVFTDIDGNEQNLSFSLNGLSASLLFIDDRQELVGTKKLFGSAPRYESLVSTREPHKISDDIIDLQVLANNCQPLDKMAHGGDVMSFRLDADTSLHLIPCWAGAYNFGYTAYKQDKHEIEQLLFASYTDSLGWTGTKYLVNPYFNERHNRLSDFYKGRGLGDCGSVGLWQWDKHYFKLLKYEHKEECDTSVDNGEEVNLGEFPAIFFHDDYIAPERN